MTADQGKFIPLEALSTEQQPVVLFSPAAQEALVLALDEAVTTGRGYYLDTGDLLIGLSQVGPLGRRLRELGVAPESIRYVKRELGGYEFENRLRSPTSSREIQAWSSIPLTQRMHKIGRIIEQAVVLDGKEIIEPEDIISVILQERNCIGAKVLQHIGIERSAIFSEPKSIDDK